jgi:thiol-disulfide isomerase/thioredoxin
MRAHVRLLLLALLALTSCDSRAPAPALSAEAPTGGAGPTPVAARPSQPASAASAPTSAGTDPRLPVLGDPLGLLSKAPAARSMPPSAKPRPGALDPAALMGSAPGAQPAMNGLERDPRAVERARIELARSAPTSVARVSVQDRSAREVVRRASQGGARVHVLLLYASYCKACRGVMPWFVQLARSYKARGVAFTAASVDADRDAFAAYAPVLETELEPIWILPDTGTKAELKRAGLKLPDGAGYSIPLFAVFAGQNRLVAQGNSRELRTLSATLDRLL